MKKNQVDKEKFIEFVSKSFDLDARFGITFSHSDFSEEVAKELAEEFGTIVGGEMNEVMNKDKSCRWFAFYDSHSISVFHQNSDDRKYVESDVSKAE